MLKKLAFLLLSLFSYVSASEVSVIGIGAPCMDIIINVDDDFIEALGNKGGTIQTDWPYIEGLIQKAMVSPSVIATGGSTANAIKGLCNLGNDCSFFGKMGHDAMGALFFDNITILGIKPLFLYSEKATQVVVSFITSDGERTMRCCPGGANDIGSDDLSPDLFVGKKLALIEGYMLYAKPDYVEHAMERAHEAGVTIAFDLCSFELVQMKKDRIMNLLHNHVDILFANADEVEALIGLEPYEACKALKEICPIVVVMIGKEGCLIGSGDQIYHCPPQPANVVDTTGAGDLFSSGFLHGYLQGKPLEECGRFGNLTGGAVCEVYGAEIAPEKWEEIKRAMNNQP